MRSPTSSPLITTLGTTAAILTSASFIHGIMISAWPIILANSVTALQAFAILWMMLRFSRFAADCKRLQS